MAWLNVSAFPLLRCKERKRFKEDDVRPLCSIALGRPALNSLAVLGEISISGTMTCPPAFAARAESAVMEPPVLMTSSRRSTLRPAMRAMSVFMR